MWGERHRRDKHAHVGQVRCLRVPVNPCPWPHDEMRARTRTLTHTGSSLCTAAFVPRLRACGCGAHLAVRATCALAAARQRPKGQRYRNRAPKPLPHDRDRSPHLVTQSYCDHPNCQRCLPDQPNSPGARTSDVRLPRPAETLPLRGNLTQTIGPAERVARSVRAACRRAGST